MEESTYFFGLIPIRYETSEEERKQILEEFPPPLLPSGEEMFQLQNEQSGNIVQVRLLLNNYSVETTKTGKQYLKIWFSNNAGTISSKMWDNNGAVATSIPLLDEYSLFDVEAKVEDYKGHKSLTIHKLKACQEDINPFTLLAYTKENIDDLTVELFSYLNELQSPFKDISLAAMHRFWDQFRLRPAAKGYHHNYLGGLLKHTVGLMRFARFILKMENNHYQAVMKLINHVEKAHKRDIWNQIQAANVNPKELVWKETIDHLYSMLYGMMDQLDTTPNYDLIMTSILFHDIGKLLEYDHAGKKYEEFKFLFPTADTTSLESRKQTGIIMDELGVMIGHIPYGVLMLSKIIETEGIAVTMEEIHHMSHCILCHHGLPEWGSCIQKPQTIDGYLIHIVDYLDSRYENTVEIK